MAQIYFDQDNRCVVHPHRSMQMRCANCGRPFCRECLVSGERNADGTRDWFCAPCGAAVATERAAAKAARTLRGRIARLRAAAAGAAPWATGMVLLAVLTGLAIRSSAARPEAAALRDAAACGELTRIRSVGAIGVPAASDALNILAYPNRATVQLLAGAAAAADSPAPAGAGADVGAMVDECDSGWQSSGTVLPVDVQFQPQREGVAWVQRIALWQDPAAPRSSWVKDFEVLASPSDDGEDFRPLVFDRPPQLSPTVEQQWFQVVQPPRAGGLDASRLAPEERSRYNQAFPDIVPVRRLRLRLLSTYGEGQAGPTTVVSLGEVAAYGPDLEVRIAFREVMVTPLVFERHLVFEPRTIRALAGRPTFVLFMNTTTERHLISTVGQDTNLNDLPIEPNQVASGQFIAAAKPGQYEFLCRVPGHATAGLTGMIAVR